MIGLANHETKDFMHQGVLVHGKRGNVYRSKLWLADRWGWSRGKVDRFLNILEKENMIQENRVRIGTVNGHIQEPIKNLQEPKRDNMPSADTSDEITEEELQRLYAELREEGYE